MPPKKNGTDQNEVNVQNEHDAIIDATLEEIAAQEQNKEVKPHEKTAETKAKITAEDVNRTMFINRLNTFNSMYKTNIDANRFIASVVEAWELLKSEEANKKVEGKKVLNDAFRDVLQQAFESERKVSYNEQRLPEYTDVTLSANELLRVSMFTFTDLYTAKKSAALFEETAFGGVNAKEVAGLTKGKSHWEMDQKSDEAWEIQSAAAKGIADKWLKEEKKPYEKMIDEMNGLIEKSKKGIIDTDRKEVFNKLVAAEWLLVNHEDMMVKKEDDPLAKIPNWGNRYWKAITKAREALGIPKHVSMRDLIQGDYAEASKAVTSVEYNERQMQEQVLDPELRSTYDDMDIQMSEFTIQREGISTSLKGSEKQSESIDEMKQDREPYIVEDEDERKKNREMPVGKAFIEDETLKKDKDKELTA